MHANLSSLTKSLTTLTVSATPYSLMGITLPSLLNTSEEKMDHLSVGSCYGICTWWDPQATGFPLSMHLFQNQ